MLLVLKFERLVINYHRFFEEYAFLFCKKGNKAKKLFDPYLYENRFELRKIYYQNDQHKKTLQTLKVSIDSDVVAGSTWRDPVDIPKIYFFVLHLNQVLVHYRIV